MKLNGHSSDNVGATKKARMRVGRGIGSGKGKTGRTRREGSEGPHRRLRSKASKAARCRCYRRLPKRGFWNNIHATRSTTRSISAACSRRWKPKQARCKEGDHGDCRGARRRWRALPGAGRRQGAWRRRDSSRSSPSRSAGCVEVFGRHGHREAAGGSIKILRRRRRRGFGLTPFHGAAG